MDLIVSKIQRFSLEDGPGIRTTIFLKGCNLRCRWCHNPEALASHPILGVDASLCDGCLRCITMCPQQALSYKDQTIQVDRNLCNNCGLCVKECFRGVFSLCGSYHTAEDLFTKIVEDLPYYTHSGGGVTFSGGEPLMQLTALMPLLKRCNEQGISTIMQTNLSLRFEESVPYVDHYMVDLKTMDNEKHQAWIGANNAEVLENLQKLDAMGASYEVRTPIIPHFNDTADDVLALVAFVKTLRYCKHYRLLAYHSLGLPKYTQFGISVPYDHSQGLDASVYKGLQDLVEKEMNR